MRKRIMATVVIAIACVAIALGFGAYWVFRCFPESSALNRMALSAVQDALGPGVRVARVRLSFPNILTFYDIRIPDCLEGCEDVSPSTSCLSEAALAAEPNRGRPPVLTAREVRVELDLMGLLFHRGRAASAIEVITLDRPELSLRRGDNGEWNISALSRGAMPGRLGMSGMNSKVVIRNGIIRVGELSGDGSPGEIGAVGGILSLHNGDVTIEEMSGVIGREGARFSLSGRIDGDGSGYSFDGSFHGLPASDASSALRLVTGAEVRQLDALGQSRLDATLHVESNGKALSYSGAASLPGRAASPGGTSNKGSGGGAATTTGLGNLVPRSFTFTIGSGGSRQEIQVFLDELKGLNLSKLEFEGQLDLKGKGPAGRPPAGPSFYRGTFTAKDGSVKARAVGPSLEGKVECRVNGEMTFEVKSGEAPRYKGTVALTAGTGTLLYRLVDRESGS
ncbi:MAG TPA: hypothetical protein GX506_03230, partial [Firmicutes bacterium]|nr:hypothetical protein [Bacillota bacterium]